MRIIDKNHDYYDYLQSPTDTIVFDRRGSFVLTKEMFLNGLWHDYSRKTNYDIVLLQCGATYWAILVNILSTNEDGLVNDYSLELLTSWKDYNKPRTLFSIKTFNRRIWDSDIIRYKANSNVLINDLLNGRYLKHEMCKFEKSISYKNTWKREILTIPILTACGIKDIVDPVDLFTALEEHFSLLKSEQEKTEPIGATNNDKIVMHGFDTKTSFRGR